MMSYGREKRRSSITPRPIGRDNFFLFLFQSERVCLTVNVKQQQEITAETEKKERQPTVINSGG